MKSKGIGIGYTLITGNAKPLGYVPYVGEGSAILTTVSIPKLNALGSGCFFSVATLDFEAASESAAAHSQQYLSRRHTAVQCYMSVIVEQRLESNHAG